MSDKRTNQKHHKEKLKRLILISLFTALIAVSSFITIPSPVPFTLQTLGIFCTLTILGGRSGTIAVLIYIFIGLTGLPVFSGFSGGPGHLLSATGGYITGFVLCALTYWLITHFSHKPWSQTAGLLSGLFVCYTTGTLWYAFVYLGDITLISLSSAFIVCVVPFIIPDIIKMLVAVIISRRLQKLNF